MALNVFTDPWIPVLHNDGSSSDVSILTALTDAHEIRTVASELPLTDAAIMRILLSVVYRALRKDALESLEENGDALEYVAQMWEAGELPAEPIRAYIETWQHRGNLIDPDHPFLQAPGLRTAKGEVKPASILRLDVAEPPALFTQADANRPLSFAEAARGIATILAWDPSGIKSGCVGDDRVKGGKGYPMGVGPCGWGAHTIVTGTTLAETLILNTIWDPIPDETDRPLWEMDAQPNGARPSSDNTMGPVSLLTWPQRRVKIFTDGEQVTGALIANGDACDYKHLLKVETLTPFRYSLPQSRAEKTSIYMPRTLTQDRAMWRGLHSLLPLDNAPMTEGYDKSKVEAGFPSANVSWLNSLYANDIIPRDYVAGLSMTSVIYGAQMATVDRILHDYLPLHASILAGSAADKIALISQVIHDADLVGGAVLRFASRVLQAGQVAGKDSAEESREKARPTAARFYDALDMPMRTWLTSITTDTDIEAAKRQAHDIIRARARQSEREILDNVPPDAWTPRESVLPIGLSYAYFRSELAKTLTPVTTTA